MSAKRVALQKGKREVCDNTDDSTWDRSQKHRKAGLDAVYRSRDFIIMLSMTSTGELAADDAPRPPDPNDRSLGKRQWELGMQSWLSLIHI